MCWCGQDPSAMKCAKQECKAPLRTTMTPASRFDFVTYTPRSQGLQNTFKERVIALERVTILNINDEEYRKKAIEALEEFYMWIGKGIRNDQIKRDGFFELQEERTDS